MTTKFSKPVYRETDFASIFSKGNRKIVAGFEPGDVITLRLKGQRKVIHISAATVFRYASPLDASKRKREKADKKKLDKLIGNERRH